MAARLRWPVSSGLWPVTALMEPETKPTVLLTLATIGENPTARRVGKVNSDPDPTIAFTIPAAKPAARMARMARGLKPTSTKIRQGIAFGRVDDPASYATDPT